MAKSPASWLLRIALSRCAQAPPGNATGKRKTKSGTDPRRPGTTRTIDLDGNPRAVRTVDMGAYERQGACN